MEQYYLAIDIGASSGRHILGHLEDGKMVLEEIYRFPNGMTEENGQRCWNVKALFDAVLEGMKKCKEAGKIPVSMGIDTWAVDFVLLDKENKMLGDAVGYRDSRTAGMDEEVYEIIPEAGVRISKIKNLEDDIALSLSALQRYLLGQHQVLCRGSHPGDPGTEAGCRHPRRNSYLEPGDRQSRSFPAYL